ARERRREAPQRRAAASVPCRRSRVEDFQRLRLLTFRRDVESRDLQVIDIDQIDFRAPTPRRIAVVAAIAAEHGKAILCDRAFRVHDLRAGMRAVDPRALVTLAIDVPGVERDALLALAHEQGFVLMHQTTATQRRTDRAAN